MTRDVGPEYAVRESLGWSTALLTALTVVVLLRPTMVGQLGVVNQVFQAAAIAAFLVLLVRSFVHHLPISGLFVALAGYRLVLLMPTIANDGDIVAWGYYTAVELALLLLVEAFASKGHAAMYGFIRVVANVLFLYLAANLATVLSAPPSSPMWNNDLSQTTYFLGIRTRLTDVLIPALLFSHLADRNRGRRIGLRTVLVAVLGVWQLTQLGVATGIVGLIILGAAYAAFRLMPWLRPALSMKSLTVFGVALSLLFVLGRPLQNEVIAGFVTDSLGKSLTLTGRTEIWALALPYLSGSPWWGYGVNHQFGAFVPWTVDRLWQAHNQYLQLAYDSGVIGVAIFVTFLLVAAARFDSASIPISVRSAVIATYAAFTVMTVSEIYTYNMGVFFLVPFLAYRIDGISALSDIPERRRIVG